MKNVLLLLLVLTTYSCAKDNEDPKNNIPPELIGKWKLTEHFSLSGSGFDGTWVEVDSGKKYDIWFKENAEVIMTAHNENCKTGTYDVVENVISYNFPCFGESNVPIDSLSSNTLITNVSYIEYELNKYQKVIE